MYVDYVPIPIKRSEEVRKKPELKDAASPKDAVIEVSMEGTHRQSGCYRLGLLFALFLKEQGYANVRFEGTHLDSHPTMDILDFMTDSKKQAMMKQVTIDICPKKK